MDTDDPTSRPQVTPADVQMMLVHYLPRRDRTPDDLINLLRRRLKRRGQDFPDALAEEVTEQN